MKNKTILVTGASRGIGREIAKSFASDNYNVCINYNNSEKEAYSLKDELCDMGCSCNIYKANVADRNQVDKMVDDIVADFGKIDVLVNNAGICEYKLFIDISNEDFLNMINTNVVGTFNVTQSVVKKSMLRSESGSIINVSSIWGLVGAALETNYSTSKAAIIGMTKALAKELGMSNIRVNAIAPGMISTEMNSHLTKEEKDNFLDLVPMGREGTLKEVVDVVKFLAEDTSSYITGQIISPNGGLVV